MTASAPTWQMGAASGFHRDSRIPSLQWAETYRSLTAGESATTGRYSSSITPYVRAWHEALDCPTCEQVTIVAGAQVGKTQFLLNVLGSIIDQAPGNILWVWPDLEQAKKFVRHRLKLLLATPRLKGKFGGHGRGAAARQEQMVFDGGSLNFVGSNSPAALASLPCRYLICDEVDRLNGDTAEGSAIELAKARTRTFFNRKILLCSTPTNRGSSQIDEQYRMGTMERYCMACEGCGHRFAIGWDDLAYTLTAKGKVSADGVSCICPQCGLAKTEAEVRAVLQRGGFAWVAEHPERREHRSFWLNAFVSPFVGWREIVEAVEGAKGNPSRLRVKKNTLLGELWEGEDIDRTLSASLMSSRQDYGLTADGRKVDVPEGVTHLAVGIDTQDKYLAYCVYGFGKSGLWCIERGNISGVPVENETFERLRDLVLLRKWVRADGETMSITAGCWDTGGHYTSAVYRHCYEWRHKRPKLHAIKGMGGENVATLRPPKDVHVSEKESKTIPLQLLGVDAYKTKAMAMISAGQIGFSSSATAGQDEHFFEELLSEKIVYEKGKARWEKIFRRNESLDCLVYALAAFELSGIRVDETPLPTPKIEPQQAQEAEDLAQAVEEVAQAEKTTQIEPQKPTAHRAVRRRGGGFNPWGGGRW